MLLYDMDVEGLGVLRIVEHFTVAGGRIARLRQIQRYGASASWHLMSLHD